jgi:SAM-dependent methyltransferase
MEGYDASTYGDRFVDVYDDWYGSITDTEACVDALVRLAVDGPVLELGVGTGRLALPLAARGLRVVGVDASRAMLDALATKDPDRSVTPLLGDMTAPPTGAERFTLVAVAYNTLFNLVAPGAQAACFVAAAQRLADGGAFVVEAFVPGPDFGAADLVAPKEVTADKVVLSVTRAHPDRQELVGQYVDITAAGIALRPWHIRWSTPAQLDALAHDAGLRLADRWADWSRTPFDDASPAHVSVYRRAG